MDVLWGIIGAFFGLSRLMRGTDRNDGGTHGGDAPSYGPNDVGFGDGSGPGR
jgi:hypothetical protein